jgi:glycosyltransferase involved in cell wall biosynthesis
MPVISIVIPLFNKEKEIQNTLESVLQQTFSNFEVLVINDGSTDGSEGKVLAFSDQRIKYIKTTNGGVSKARNTGIQLATAPLIAFLDADDLWLPNHLDDLIELQNDFPEAGLLIKNYKFVYAENHHIQPVFNGIDNPNFRGIVKDFFQASLNYRLAWTSAVAVPKSVFEQVGVFDEKITLGAGEDTDLWTRIALKYPVVFDSKISALYKTDASNRISHSQTLKRSFSKLNKFSDEEKSNPSLKLFMDRYRVEYAIRHKLAGDNETCTFYLKQVDKKNINTKTQLLLALPPFLLKPLYRLKKALEKRKLFISVYD